MSKGLMDVPEKCKGCMHPINDYCRAYRVKIDLIDVDKCKRKKQKKTVKKILF